ncbi:MAG: hypothetical protein JOY82_00135 [Streptosporangiaceae bacterium]|nr:hypothetical protein [Streptosporangiaceae bacterium]
MFASDEKVVGVRLAAAQARLANLVDDGWLSGVSGEVYQRSAGDLVRVGPFGEVPGASRLVRVRFTDPAYRDEAMSIGLRWEAAGVTGGLFPALDADIWLTADGDQRTRVTLSGSYRPPLGVLGAGLDRLILRKVAAATITTLLTRIATALEGAPAAGLEAAAPPQPDRSPKAQARPRPASSAGLVEADQSP